MKIIGYPCTSVDIPWYPWLSMDVHGYPVISMAPNGTPLEFKGCQPDHSRWFCCARICSFLISRVHFFNFKYLHIFRTFCWEQPWTTKDRVGGSQGLQGPFWWHPMCKWLFKKSQNRENLLLQFSQWCPLYSPAVMLSTEGKVWDSKCYPFCLVEETIHGICKHRRCGTWVSVTLAVPLAYRTSHPSLKLKNVCTLLQLQGNTWTRTVTIAAAFGRLVRSFNISRGPFSGHFNGARPPWLKHTRNTENMSCQCSFEFLWQLGEVSNQERCVWVVRFRWAQFEPVL